ARAVAPDDTTRAGLYVMLSRARTDLVAYVVRRRDLEANLDDEDWLPVLPDPTGAVNRLSARLAASRTERLASDHDPLARAAHQLRRRHSLADLARLRSARVDPVDLSAPEPESAGRREAALARLVLRRAELAAESALRAAAGTNPPAEVVERLGPRPAAGPDRTRWDRAVGA
nr:hypothetical protein [Micromonospora sp. DSM 115978]